MSGNSDLLDLEMQMHAETAKAVLVSDDGSKENAVWLPKSQVEIERHKDSVTITLPEWLALDKGLI